MFLGTADYIAPEQIDTAHTADARADVYGLGATLYFLLAGVPPFSGDRYRTWLDKLRAQGRAAPSIHRRRPDVPAALASLLERMLAKDPAARPTTPGEVAEALLPFTAGADLVGLLAHAGGSAALRVAAPSTRTHGGVRGVRGAALHYGLTAVAGTSIALLAAAPFLGARAGKFPKYATMARSARHPSSRKLRRNRRASGSHMARTAHHAPIIACYPARRSSSTSSRTAPGRMLGGTWTTRLPVN